MCSEPINGPVIPAGIPRSSQSSVRGRHILDLSHTERFDNLDQRGCIFSLFFNVASRAGGHTTTAATITFLPGHICPGAIQLQSLWPWFLHPWSPHQDTPQSSQGFGGSNQTLQNNTARTAVPCCHCQRPEEHPVSTTTKSTRPLPTTTKTSFLSATVAT